MTFTVGNSGMTASGTVMASIIGSGASQFTIESNNCGTLAPGATCQITVDFTPTTAGAKTASLNVTAAPGNTATASLDGTGIRSGQLDISPAGSQNLGSAVVGVASTTTATFTVTNTGQTATSAVSVSPGGTNQADFAKSADTCTTVLAAGATCSFTVTFTPTAAGARSALYTVQAAVGGSITAPVTGTGLVPAQLDITPSLQPFGSIVVGASSADITFTVRNTGGVPTSAITVSQTGDSADFVGTTDCAAALAPNATCTVVRHFTPTAAGGRNATLTVTATTGGTDSSALSGTGVPPGQITISDNPFVFTPDQTVGTSSIAKVFTVTNTGGANSGVLTTALGGSNAADFVIVTNSNGCAGADLIPNGQCQIAVTFTPLTAGAKSAVLTVTGVNVATAGLSGNAIDGPNLVIAPPTQDFGSIGTGTTTPFVTFTVSNTGGQPTNGAPSIVLGGANATQFGMNNNLCTAPLAAQGQPGSSCTVQVRFAPTINNTSDTATLTASAPGTSFTSTLFGRAVDPAQIQQTGGPLTFPTTRIGDTSLPLTFTVTNNGTETTGTINVTKSGTNAADFNVTHDCTTLAMNFTCTVTVTFAPGDRGNRTASVDVSASPGGTLSVGVSGVGQSRLELTGTVNGGLTTAGGSHAFVDTIISTSSPTSVDLHYKNNIVGAAGSTSTIATVPPADGSFVIASNTCTNTIANNGGTCDITINFLPTTTGNKTSNVTVNINGGGANNSQVVNLTGKGVDSLQITPMSTNQFGNVARGTVSSPLVFLVSNPAAAPTSGQIGVTLTGAGYQLTGNTCTTLVGGASACMITVVFAPIANGSSPGSIVVRATPGGSVTQALLGAGVDPAGFSASVSPIAFGNVFSGATKTLTSVITNTGGVPAAALGTITVTGTGYSLASPSLGTDCKATTVLAAGGTCNLRITFAPTGTTFGAVSGNVSFSTAPGGSQSINLSGTSVSTISVSPDTQPYGAVNLGTTQNHDFTVTNNSAASVTITSAVLTPSNVEVTITANNCATLAAGASCVITVRYAPVNPGTFTESLTVSSANGIAIATLTGSANTVANVNWTETFTNAAPFLYGTTLAGELGLSRTFTLRNDGQTTAPAVAGLILSDAVDWTITSQNCIGTALPAAGTCTVTVRYNPMPSNGATADQSSTLSAMGVTGTGSQTLNFFARRMAVNSMTFTPTVDSFASTVVGGTSATRTITIQNTSGASQNFNAYVFTSPNVTTCAASPDYTIVGGTCGTILNQPACGNYFSTTLNAGQSCTMVIQFNPSAVGTRFGYALAVKDDLVAQVPFSPYAPLTGVGLAPAAVSVAVTGPGAAFGNVALGDTSTSTYTYTNNGEVPSGQVVITGPTGAASNQYSITNNTCTGPLAANGGNCSVKVNFTPTTVGNKAASFNAVATPGYPTTDTNLTGFGVLQATLGITPTVPQMAGTRVVGLTDNTGTTFTITNGGDVVTGPLSASLSDGTNWHIASNTCTGTLGVGASCTVNVTFDPQTVTNGLATTLTVSGTPGGTVTGTISGDGTSALTSPASKALGSVNAGNAGANQTITFTNNASVATGVLHTTLAGADAGLITIVNDGCAGKQLDQTGGANDDCDIVIRLTPPTGTAGHAISATLSAQGTPGNSATTNLTGNVN